MRSTIRVKITTKLVHIGLDRINGIIRLQSTEIDGVSNYTKDIQPSLNICLMASIMLSLGGSHHNRLDNKTPQMSDAVDDELILNRIKVLYVKPHQNSMKGDHTGLQEMML